MNEKAKQMQCRIGGELSSAAGELPQSHCAPNKTSSCGDEMDQKTVRKLEEQLEEAIAEVIMGMSRKKLPLSPSRLTVHLMAKAAVTVYEAAVENRNRD
jgi:hypothetical protein